MNSVIGTREHAPPHVLIADDDPSCLAILTDAFHREGFATSGCLSGAEAWAAIEEHPRLSIAVLNWMLPDLDGLWIARRMRQQGSPALIAMMIGRWCLSEAGARLDLQADYILPKPFPADGIDHQVQRIAAWSHAGSAASISRSCTRATWGSRIMRRPQ
jgi:two-component system OmpR family response regulator